MSLSVDNCYELSLIGLNLSLQLDANKSPLALLAKTCSSIGVDSPNSKLLGSSDKNRDHNNSSTDKRKTSGSSSVNSINGDDDNSSQSNTTSTNSAKVSFKPYETTTKKSNNFNNNIGERNCDLSNDLVVSDKKTPTLKVSSSPKSNASTARTSPLSGKNTPSGRHSASNLNDNNNSSTKPKNESHSPKTTSSTSALNGTAVSSMSSSTTSSALSFTSLGLPDMRLESHKDSINSLSNLYKSNPFSSNCCPINGMAPTSHLSVDKTGAYPSIYPPLSYARMKTANGGQAILPTCRDPYCNGSCQLTAMQSAAILASAAANTCSPNSCPNGCNQCDHQRLQAMSSALAASAAYPHLNPALIPGFSQAYASGLYSGLSPSLPRPQSANICNWIAGDSHCGKRFANSEELLQHLRTHTSSSVESSSASVASLMSPSLSSSLAAHMHYSTAGSVPPPSLTTAAGLRRTYPTSLSPLSNRFHPYKPSVIPGLGSMPSMPSVNPMVNPLHNSSALSMYYPYGLYSGRIGPPVHP